MPSNATLVTILYVLLFAITPHLIKASQPLQRIRNQYLRMYLAYKKERVKQYLFASKDVIKDKVNTIYQSIMSKYYDANGFYYSLSPEDRELIDQIINLHF